MEFVLNKEIARYTLLPSINLFLYYCCIYHQSDYNTQAFKIPLGILEGKLSLDFKLINRSSDLELNVDIIKQPAS